MNSQRAKQISQSADMANVIYNGESIYIQHVDSEKGTARIYPLSNPDDEFEVPVDILIEQQ